MSKDRDFEHIAKLNDMMHVTHPHNPFGYNYEMKERYQKLYIKFKQIKKYVHLEKEDIKKDTEGKLYFTSGCALTFVSAFIPTYLFGLAIKKKNRPHSFFMLITMVAIPTWALSIVYKPLSMYMVSNYYISLIDKYKPIAINNGFEDYEISEFKGEKSFYDRHIYDKFISLPKLDE